MSGKKNFGSEVEPDLPNCAASHSNSHKVFAISEALPAKVRGFSGIGLPQHEEHDRYAGRKVSARILGRYRQ